MNVEMLISPSEIKELLVNHCQNKLCSYARESRRELISVPEVETVKIRFELVKVEENKNA